LTRSAASLLASGAKKGAIQMEEGKTYFEQIPLEIVKKIVDEELRREKSMVQSKAAKKKI
jgi:hypothetical protein